MDIPRKKKQKEENKNPAVKHILKDSREFSSEL